MEYSQNVNIITLRKTIIGSIGFILFILIWTIIYASGIYNSLIIPSPLKIFNTIIISFIDLVFLRNFGVTLLRMFLAFLIASTIGIILGVLLGYYKILDDSSKTLIDFLRSIPSITLFPLFILLFGVNDTSRVLVAVFSASLFILVNTKYGVINSKEVRKNLHKLYPLSKIEMFSRVILPEASPYVFNGLRIGISITTILIIVTEMLLGTEYGLGHLLTISLYEFETEMIYSIIIITGILGFLLNLGFNSAENKIFHWRSK